MASIACDLWDTSFFCSLFFNLSPFRLSIENYYDFFPHNFKIHLKILGAMRIITWNVDGLRPMLKRRQEGIASILQKLDAGMIYCVAVSSIRIINEACADCSTTDALIFSAIPGRICHCLIVICLLTCNFGPSIFGNDAGHNTRNPYKWRSCLSIISHKKLFSDKCLNDGLFV